MKRKRDQRMNMKNDDDNTQELVLHDIPFNLGDKRRYSGVGGIQAYVSYLEECVLMPELRFSDPGERWRIVARVLQVRAMLLYSNEAVLGALGC